MTSDSPINWTAETEVCLFYAMRGQKPIGLNKHFHMMCIHQIFCQSYGQPISSEQIWKHLGEMYNLKALDDSEISRIKNVKQEFKLPPEIMKFKVEQVKNSSEDSLYEEEPASAKSSSGSKSSRKRTRNALAPSNPSSPAPPSTKRRRQ